MRLIVKLAMAYNLSALKNIGGKENIHITMTKNDKQPDQFFFTTNRRSKS